MSSIPGSRRRRLAAGVLLLWSFSAGSAWADSGGGFLNIGIKIGYTVGPAGGFTMGGEASATWFLDERGFIPGVVAGVYSCKKRVVTHLGVQATHVPSLFGAGVGPAFVRDEEGSEVDLKLDTYWGFVAMPHYSRIFRGAKPGLDELGVYLKLPIPLKKDMFRQ